VGLLKRSFLGWLRAEKRHCIMVAVPMREAEDDKRSLRERERFVDDDATRLVNRMKGPLAPHGIAKFEVRSKTTPHDWGWWTR
jgi:transposase